MGSTIIVAVGSKIFALRNSVKIRKTVGVEPLDFFSETSLTVKIESIFFNKLMKYPY